MRYFLLTICAFFIAISGAAQATEKKPDHIAMQDAMKLGQPSEAHDIFKTMEGSWNFINTFKMTSETPEQISEGTAEHKLILGGRFLEQIVVNPMEMDGQSFNYEGRGFLGYDNREKVYKSYWIDNMNTSMMIAEGVYDEATKTIKEEGEHFCPIQEKVVNFKSEMKIEDDNHMTYTMYNTGLNGDYYKMMEIKYTRK